MAGLQKHIASYWASSFCALYSVVPLQSVAFMQSSSFCIFVPHTAQTVHTLLWQRVWYCKKLSSCTVHSLTLDLNLSLWKWMEVSLSGNSECGQTDFSSRKQTASSSSSSPSLSSHIYDEFVTKYSISIYNSFISHTLPTLSSLLKIKFQLWINRRNVSV